MAINRQCVNAMQDLTSRVRAQMLAEILYDVAAYRGAHPDRLTDVRWAMEFKDGEFQAVRFVACSAYGCGECIGIDLEIGDGERHIETRTIFAPFLLNAPGLGRPLLCRACSDRTAAERFARYGMR